MVYLLIAALALGLAFTYQFAEPAAQAFAADKSAGAMAVDQTVSGTGKETKGSFKLNPGLVTLEVSYSGNSFGTEPKQFTLYLKKEGSSDFYEIISEDCAGRAFTKKITVASYNTGQFGIQAFSAQPTCSWSVKISQKAKKAVPSGTQSYAKNGFSGIGAKSQGSFFLLPGTCTIKSVYSGNKSLISGEKTNFIVWLRSEDESTNKTLARNDIALSGNYTHTVNIYQAGWFYLDVDKTSPECNWSITIEPKKMAAPKVKAGKKQMTVSWKKSSASGLTKYQVRYRINGTSAWKTKAVSKSKNKITIKKLKAGKKYDVQVRTYIKVGNKTVKDIWSKTRTSAKIKK